MRIKSIVDDATHPALNGVEALADPESIYEMATLPPDLTGLSTPIWVSPRIGAKHEAHLRVTLPPFGAHPIAVYQVKPFGFMAGVRWLDFAQERELASWVTLNDKTLLDFWDEKIHYYEDLKARLINTQSAPPGNKLEAVVALRACARQVKSIWWDDGSYNLFFDRFLPNHAKIAARFAALDFNQPVTVNRSGHEAGMLLWPLPNG